MLPQAKSLKISTFLILLWVTELSLFFKKPQNLIFRTIKVKFWELHNIPVLIKMFHAQDQGEYCNCLAMRRVYYIWEQKWEWTTSSTMKTARNFNSSLSLTSDIKSKQHMRCDRWLWEKSFPSLFHSLKLEERELWEKLWLILYCRESFWFEKRLLLQLKT